MKVAYFDCFSGISGDMVLGALVDVGWSVEELKREIEKLDLPYYQIKAKKVIKRGIFSTQVRIDVKEEKKERTLKDILSILDKSKLEEGVKKQSRAIFIKLARVEAEIHGKDMEKIHFHELGSLDTIIDVVGAVVGIKHLGIEKVYSSPLPLGRGFIKCEHGILPVPAPATLRLLKEVPVYGSDIEAELVTPTGAGIISTLAEDFGKMPPMKIESIGYGAGQRDLPIPNLLRISIGVLRKVYEKDVVSLIQTNIDDMNPEFYEHIVDRLFCEGALDVFLTPIQMKKTRPATMLSVMVNQEKVEKMLAIIFNETTTLGVRISKIERRKLMRESRKVATKYGRIEVKIGKLDGVIKNISPSYEECRKVALHLNIPLKKVYQEVKETAFNLLMRKNSP